MFANYNVQVYEGWRPSLQQFTELISPFGSVLKQKSLSNVCQKELVFKSIFKMASRKHSQLEFLLS